MADPVVRPVAPASVPAAPAPAPVEAAPAPAPAPVIESAPAPSVAPVTPAPAAPAAPTSLLSEPPKPAPAAEPPKATDPAQAPAPTPPPAPIFEVFTLPEGIQLDPKELGKFTETLAKLELETKADHAKLQVFGQEMISTYVAEMQRVQQAGQDAWTRMRDDWRGNFIKDPDLGGTNQASTLSRCASMIDQYGGSAAQIAELRGIFAMTGAGDHPAVIRLLNNIGKVLAEPTTTATGKQVTPQSAPRSQRRYAGTLGANGAN